MVATRRIKILFLGASPKDRTRVRVDEEVRSIQERLNRGEYGDRFEVIMEPAVRASELSAHLLKHKPDIVHISGHSEREGTKAARLLFEDFAGEAKPVPVEALAKLFDQLRDNIRCVVLSACFSEDQARAISKHVDVVIGVTRAVSDEATVVFAERFYGTLAEGKSVEVAFHVAQNDVGLDGLPDGDAFGLYVSRVDPRLS